MIPRVLSIFKDSTPLLIGVMIAIFFSLHGYQAGTFYGVIDSSFSEIKVSSDFTQNFYWWGDWRSAGELQSSTFPRSIETLYFGLLKFIVSDPQMVGLMNVLFLTVLTYVATYCALISFKEFFPSSLSKYNAALLSLLILFNLFFLYTNQTILPFYRYSYIIFCFILCGLNKINTKQRWIILPIFLLSLGAWDQFPYWLPLLLILFVFSLYYLFQRLIDRKIFFLFWLIYIVVSIPAIISIFYYAINLNLGTSNVAAYSKQVFLLANRNSFLSNVFSFIGGVNWGLNWNWKPVPVFPYFDLFTTNFMYITILYVPFGIVFSFLLLGGKGRSSFRLVLFSLISFFIFFIAAYNAPFGDVYSYLFKHVPIFQIYRESHNKFYPGLIFLVILTIYLHLPELTSAIRRIVYNALIAYVVAFGAFSLATSVYSGGNFFSLPESYFYISSQVRDDDSVVLILPGFSNIQSYSYGHYGISPLQNTLRNPTTLEYNLLESKFNLTFTNTILDDFNYKTGAGVYSRGSANPTFSNSSLSNTNINYIILDGYVNGVPAYSGTDFIDLKDKIDALQEFEFLESSDKLYLYKRKVPQNLFLSPDVTYTKISPVEYLVSIRNVSTSSLATLIFLQSYNSGWKLYPADKARSSRNPLPFKMGYLFEKPLFDSTHRVVYKYANTWSLDISELNRTPNASSTVNLILYFKPQSYLYISILIALILFSFLWLCVVYKSPRK